MVLTQLAYYDKGLDEKQLVGAMEALGRQGKSARESEYEDCWLRCLEEGALDIDAIDKHRYCEACAGSCGGHVTVTALYVTAL